MLLVICPGLIKICVLGDLCKLYFPFWARKSINFWPPVVLHLLSIVCISTFSTVPWGPVKMSCAQASGKGWLVAHSRLWFVAYSSWQHGCFLIISGDPHVCPTEIPCFWSAFCPIFFFSNPQPMLCSSGWDLHWFWDFSGKNAASCVAGNSSHFPSVHLYSTVTVLMMFLSSLLPRSSYFSLILFFSCFLFFFLLHLFFYPYMKSSVWNYQV